MGRCWLRLMPAVVGVLGVAAIPAWGDERGEKEEHITLKEAPRAVRAVVTRAAEGGKLLELERERKGRQTVYEAEILKGGKVVEIVLSSNGRLLAIEVEEKKHEEHEAKHERAERHEREERKARHEEEEHERAERAKARKHHEEEEQEREERGERHECARHREREEHEGRHEMKKARKRHEHEEKEEGEEEEHEEAVSLKRLPEPVRRTVARLTRGGEIEGIAVEREHGVKCFEVEWEVGERELEADIAPDGSVLEIEQKVSLRTAPAGVRRTVAKLFPRGTRVEVEKVTVFLYEIEAKVKGREREVLVSPTGRVIKVEEEDED